MKEAQSDILVIGGGVVGVCVARELQAAGHSVVLLEKGKVGEGCSYGNAGWITPCFAMPLPQPGMFLKSIRWLLDSSSPLHIQPSLDPVLARWLFHFLLAMNQRQMLKAIEVLTELSHYSLNFYSELASRHPSAGIHFEKKGLLMVSATREGVAAAKMEMDLMAERGIPGRSLSREEALELEPMLKPIVQGGVYFPEEAQVEPYPNTLAIAEEFRALGGRVIEHAEVYDFELSGQSNRLDGIKIEGVVTTQGKFHCKRAQLVVLATGSWSPDLAKRLGLRIPILGGKGYSMSVMGAEKKPRHPIMLVDRKIAVTPYQDRIRLAGTLEIVNQDFGISVNRLKAIEKGAQDYLDLRSGKALSGDAPEIRDVWRGLRPCTPDGVPMIGFSKKLSNLFYCVGHQMLGLQSAPGSARLTRDLIAGKTPLADPVPFRPERFE